MGNDPNFAAEPDSATLEFERIEGELEAAIVFAAAAEFQFQNGNPEFAATCLSDAVDGYTTAVRALPTANLAGAQLEDLTARLIQLKHLLDGLRTPIRNEAA